MTNNESSDLLGYVVVSDLHLGPGKQTLTPHSYMHEDFFSDKVFADFLHKLDDERPCNSSSKKWRLIINGDFFEFMQILCLPTPLYDEEQWNLGGGVTDTVPMTQDENEKRDGLVTSELKSAWKLGKVGEGHPEFFKALAEFVWKGNDLVLVKGNHDVEFYWPKVRKKFVELLNDALVQKKDTQRDPQKVIAQKDTQDEILKKWEESYFFENEKSIWTDKGTLKGTLQFCEEFYQDGPLYAEHGNQHDPANKFREFKYPVHPLFPAASDAKNNKGEALIEFPFGSIFVRYFFNEVEKYFSYADNIKPTTEALREISRRHPWQVIKILASRIRPLVRALTFPPAWIELRKVIKPIYITYVLIAIFVFIFAIFFPVWDAVLSADISFEEPNAIKKTLFAAYGTVKKDWGWFFTLISFAFPFFADFISRHDDKFLRKAAVQKIKVYPCAHFFVYGHTHDPDIWLMQDKDKKKIFYYNTGTWTQVFSWEERLRRPPEQFVFLKILRDHGNNTGWKSELRQWLPQVKDSRLLMPKEDSKAVMLKSKSYLALEDLDDPVERPLSVVDRVTVVDRARSYCNPRIKQAGKLYEFIMGLPTVVLWSIMCIVFHLIRPFWWLLWRPIWGFGWGVVWQLTSKLTSWSFPRPTMKFRWLNQLKEIKKDFRLMKDWFRVSYEMIWKN